MSLASVAVVLMAKYPHAGRVKTRLSPALSPQQAADVQRAFLLHVAGRVERLDPQELIVCFDPPDAGPAMRDLLADVCSATYLAQCPGDLGARLASAARMARELHRRTLFLGVDSPDVPDAHLTRAAKLADQAAVTLGPTDDGGYWSLGLSDDVDADALLTGINWSSGREAKQTLQHAEALGYAAQIAPAWDDIDRPEDLRRMIHRLKRSQASDADHRRLLESLMSCTPAELLK